MPETPLPSPSAPERRETRDDIVASRLARLGWRAQGVGECRQCALDAGETELAARLTVVLEKIARTADQQRAWLRVAAQWDAAGVDTAFLSDLDPEKLALLPDADFRKALEKCPGATVPGRTAPTVTAAPAVVPEAPKAAPAPFSTAPVLGPAAPVPEKGPAWDGEPVLSATPKPKAAPAEIMEPIRTDRTRVVAKNQPQTRNHVTTAKKNESFKTKCDRIAQTHLSDLQTVEGRAGFHRRAKRLALAVEREFGIPWQVCMAQAVLESGHGESPGARDHNVIFGKKARKGDASVEMWTNEVVNGETVRVKEKFAKYESMAESFADYARFVTQSKRYARAFAYAAPLDPLPAWYPADYSPKNYDPVKFVHALADAGYAGKNVQAYKALAPKVMRSGFMRAEA